MTTPAGEPFEAQVFNHRLALSWTYLGGGEEGTHIVCDDPHCAHGYGEIIVADTPEHHPFTINSLIGGLMAHLRDTP